MKEKVKNKKKNIKKESKDVVKKKIEKKDKLLKIIKNKEVLFCLLVGIVFLVLLVLTMTSDVYLPACLISLSLELFSICYYYLNDTKNKKLVYILFIVGVILVITAVVYTMVHVI